MQRTKMQLTQRQRVIDNMIPQGPLSIVLRMDCDDVIANLCEPRLDSGI